MTDSLAAAHVLLQHHFGYTSFRPAQIPVIRSILEGHDTLAVLPTGGGKSICFQIPALVLGGLTLVVSPLISLMQDQVDAARARGVPAAALNSSLNAAAQREVRAGISEGTLRLLYVSPERLDRLSVELQRDGIRPRLLVVDEAHCIAEWGHDFRPSYRKLGRIRYRLAQPQTVALTGSATPEVRADIASALRLRRGHALHLGSFDRANLWFGAVRVQSEAERLRALLALLRGDDVIAIVYAPTRRTTESIAGALTQAGHRAVPYHAGLSKVRRSLALEDFLRDRVDVVVATCAFGLGIDKPNVRLVVHWAPPATPEAYYQESGRAGRDGEFARCVLLWRDGDVSLHRRQLDVTFPPRELLQRIWLEPGGTTGVPANVLESAERLRCELHPERGAIDWRPVVERRRRAELRIRAVSEYARGARCRRSLLVGYFGETLSTCAGCDRCAARPASPRLAPDVRARLTRLRHALSGNKTVWGGSPLEPDVLLELARCPPGTAGALADVPGVGPALVERLGGTILGALSDSAIGADSAELAREPVGQALEGWRSATAREMGLPAYRVLTDATLTAIASTRPQSRPELAKVPGVGPRLLEKFGSDLLRLIATDGRSFAKAPPQRTLRISAGLTSRDRDGGH